MIIYLSLESKSSAISKIEEFLKKKFERVVFEDRILAIL